MNLKKLHNDIHEGALQLMAEHRVQLFAKAKSLCDNEDEANELVIRTIDQAIRKIDTYSGEGDILSWMMAILENLHNHDWRSPVVRGTTVLDGDELEKLVGADWSTDEQILKNSDGEAVRTALRQIDPEFKRLVLMRYYDEFTLREIANVLNMPISTVGRRMQMALRILAGKLEAEFSKAKPKLALLGAFLLAGSLFGAAVWGVAEAVSAVGSLGSEGSLASEETLGSEGALGSLESEGSLGSAADPVDPNPDPIVPKDSTETVPSPLSATGADTTGAATLSTTENTEKEETMNLKSITKSAAKLAIGAALTTGASTAMADGWFYADGAITDSNGIRCPVSANGSLLTVNSGTSFSGVTDIDFSKPIVDGAGNAYAIGAIADAAFYSSAVTSIRLPDTITTIGGFAFQFCTAITNITPFLPSSVTQIGIKAFNGATNLRGELTIGVSGTDFSFGGEQVFDSASSVTSLVLDGTLASMPSAEFYNCTSLEKVVIGEGTQVIGTFAFQMCTVLKSVEFKGYSNWAADSSFKTIPDYQVLFEVPSGDVQWKTFLENAGNVTPWDGLGPDVQQKFYDVHGAATDDPVPYGLVSPSVGGGSTQWIAYKMASGSKYHLQVVGERDGQPFDVGVLSPAYGSFENDVLPTPCRCEVLETNVCGETALYECYGHEFAQFDGGTAVDVRTNLSLTCQFAPEAGGSYRVKWLWRTVGYKLTIAYPNELGEVTVDGESEEYYRVGLPVTVSATGKNGAAFVRWFGDVPAGADKSASLELVMDEARTICPYFRKNWQLVGSTMSDGYWTLNVVVTTDSNGQDGVSVSGVSSRVDYLKFLDLAKAIDADGEVRLVLIGLGNAAFYAQDIVEVTLPETLTTIGGFAFQNCGALEKVTPLLPPSVSSIGLAAFENCAKLIGTAMLGARKRTLVLADRVFSSASLLEGLVIRGDCATLPSTFAYSCTSLKRIETPSEMTQLGDFAFQFCTGVKTLTFRSRPQWEEKTFDGWADFGTIVYVPSNDKGWQSVLGDKELVTPWRDLTDEMRQTFTDGHAGARRPKGLMQPTLGLGRQWIDVTPSPGFMLLLY